MKDNFEFNVATINRPYRTHLILLLLVLLLTSILTAIIVYYSLKTELEREGYEETNRVSEKITKKINFYKAILVNTIEKIGEKSLFDKPDSIYELLFRNYQLLQKHNLGHETVTIRWIGRYPNNYEIDQFGIKKHIGNRERTDNVDEQGISSQITESNNSNIRNKKVYKLCFWLNSYNAANLGYLCVIEDLQDFFNNIGENKSTIVAEPIYMANLSEMDLIKSSQDSFIFINHKLQKDLNNQVSVVGKVLKTEFEGQMIKRLFYSLSLIAFLGLILFCLLISFSKKAISKLNSLDKYIDASECEYKAIIAYMSNLEIRLSEVIESSEQQLLFIINNAYALKAGSSIHLLNKIYNELHNTYNSNKVITPITTGDIKSTLGCFSKVILAKKISFQYKIDNKIDGILIDSLLVQIILSSFINELITGLPPKGKLIIAIAALEDGNQRFFTILLKDNSLNLSSKRRDESETLVFLSTEKASKLIEFFNGSIKCENTVYQGKRIEIRLPEKLKAMTESDNVIKLY